MSKATQWFRIAVAGPSIDGRTIEQQWLKDMADTYDTNKYQARVWLEHLRSTMPDSPFCAYGDVTALKSEEVEISGEKKLALFAQIDALPQLVEINKKSQKVFASIEVKPNFADSGKTYLGGLGITDSPASLGTEKLKFSSAFANVRFGESESNIFSVPIETLIELTEEKSNTGWFDKFKAMFTAKDEQNDANFSNVEKAVQMVGERQLDVEKNYTKLQADHNKLSTDFNQLKAAHDAMSQKLHFTPAPNQHVPPSGGNSTDIVDC